MHPDAFPAHRDPGACLHDTCDARASKPDRTAYSDAAPPDAHCHATTNECAAPAHYYHRAATRPAANKHRDTADCDRSATNRYARATDRYACSSHEHACSPNGNSCSATHCHSRAAHRAAHRAAYKYAATTHAHGNVAPAHEYANRCATYKHVDTTDTNRRPFHEYTDTADAYSRAAITNPPDRAAHGAAATIADHAAVNRTDPLRHAAAATDGTITRAVGKHRRAPHHRAFRYRNTCRHRRTRRDAAALYTGATDRHPRIPNPDAPRQPRAHTAAPARYGTLPQRRNQCGPYQRLRRFAPGHLSRWAAFVAPAPVANAPDSLISHHRSLRCHKRYGDGT